MSKFYMEDGGVIGEYITEGTTVHRRLLQPERQAILKRNQELRKDKNAIKTTSFGKLELDIPLSDWSTICKLYPGIGENSHPQHKLMLRKFMASSASDPYRLQDRSKLRG
jgi:hypothetical protein